MKSWWPVVFLLFIAACSEKKPDFSGEQPVKAEVLWGIFPEIKGSFSAADTNLTKLADTTVIGYKAILQFVPDTILVDIIGKETRQTIRPVGKIHKDNVTYLLLNFTNPKKLTQLGVFVFDKKNKFLAGMKLLDTQRGDGYVHTVSINREPTFFIGKEKRGREENTLLYSRSGWVYNSAGMFMVVVKDSNEGIDKNAAVLNPLDTLPAKGKYSGDYVRNKRNFISIRDSEKANSYRFFVHFEKEGDCIGELKGEMTMNGTNTARYAAKGDPCTIDFSFEGNRVIMRETGTCGNHRGMKCQFDDSFTKKKETKKKKSS